MTRTRSPATRYPLLQRWLKAGYAVVRTDYEGLGTPGVHQYLVGKSEGRSVLDAVRAARALEPRCRKRFVIAGHSQGGHAALFAAARRRSTCRSSSCAAPSRSRPPRTSRTQFQTTLGLAGAGRRPRRDRRRSACAPIDIADPGLGVPRAAHAAGARRCTRRPRRSVTTR